MSTPNIRDPIPAVENMGVSFGLAPILMQFMEWARIRNRPQWDLYLVNAMTFLRNNWKKDISWGNWLVDTERDISTLYQYLTQYLSLDTVKSKVKPKLVIYLPHYQIPEAYAKPLAASWQTIQDGTIKWAKRQWSTSFHKGEQINLHTVLVGDSKQLPHLALWGGLRKLDSRCQHYRTLHFNHVALDFEIARQFLHYQYMESHTAKLKDKTTLGEKVFKKPNLPLCPTLHLLLGDGQFIKRAIDLKSSRTVYALAESQKWPFKSESLIIKELVKQGILKGRADFDLPL